MKLSENRLDTNQLSNRSSLKSNTPKRSDSCKLSYRNSVKSLKGNSNKDGGILHQIPDIDVPYMEITKEYDILKNIAEGCFAKIYLVHHRPIKTNVVLKAIHTELTTFKEFLKEFHYSYQLSHHPNILSSYNVAFQSNDYFVFAQEHAPFGDLSANLGPGGLQESSVKSIASQLSSALGFMHSKSLVHRDIKLENVNANFGSMFLVTIIVNRNFFSVGSSVCYGFL